MLLWAGSQEVNGIEYLQHGAEHRHRPRAGRVRRMTPWSHSGRERVPNDSLACTHSLTLFGAAGLKKKFL